MLTNQKSGRLGTACLLSMIVLYSSFLIFRISTFPNVFIDEGNGMYDSWCMAFYGVDSNLLKNPIYLPGCLGQGQSVLYPFIAGFSMRLLGYNIFAYRLPLVIISIFNYVLLVLVVRHHFGRMDVSAASASLFRRMNIRRRGIILIQRNHLAQRIIIPILKE